ncbi:MAG: anthranilate phosphoribosyltransferase [Chloroflexi bacterium RBG_16_60_22]|nr:MAG: anthranilate phosphoribosyltransferase [Chloroflexi bacterium RBG_16_60_22]
MIKEAIAALVEGQSLTFEQASGAMVEIMGGEATPAQIAAFLTALRIKGETADEIAGLASVMRAKATPVKVSGPLIDIVGTGGDASGSFNISTAAALVVAGAGLKVAKHGNRAASSKCGSADVLEALGVKIELGPEAVAGCIEKVGIGFMFAPMFHPAMKHAAPVRREIGIRTVFNILGPLTNPARADHLLLGVPSEELGHKIAAVLRRLGTKHSLVVHGKDGLDEISISAASLIWEVREDRLSPVREVTPESFGFKKADKSEIRGGTPEENAAMMRRVLGGEKSALRNAVVINAAAALVAGNVTADLKEGARLAGEAIDSGRAADKLKKLAELSQRPG